MENRERTEEEIRELIYISINQITEHVADMAMEKVRETFCPSCPTPCNGWCDKATEVAKTLTNHYIIYKARWN